MGAARVEDIIMTVFPILIGALPGGGAFVRRGFISLGMAMVSLDSITSTGTPHRPLQGRGSYHQPQGNGV